MGWRSIIISQHAKMSYSSRAMIVQTMDGINQIPIDDIDLVLVSTTQAVITTALISELAQSQVKVIFTDNSSEPVCETLGYYPNNRDVDLVKKQFNWDEKRKQLLWTKIVVSKIMNQINVLKIYGVANDDLIAELDKLEVNDVTNREAVVARKYFPLLFDNKFNRHDFSPVNAALNYGYAILLSNVNREIVANGYLTYLGIHHHSNENQFNLGSDLMEPFRPAIDYWLANQKFKELTPDIKFGLVDLLNLELTFNGKQMLLRNIITDHVRNCLKYLSGDIDEIQIEVTFKNEVPNNAINGNV
ncbi:type II CRISPR-associated endonuclease Cas1 [Liquorilactobacillus nagelii]|uniref:type II CRISPR-associated endonuclease Cas1 n=1 Tax=Liquorilactobacillus nagelii TaxID=82688 RepID=UPI001CCCC9A0|nr:type II CRISPR-associated endonuclease Cas1 [Liquorilactobacillus nagelii]ULQ49132.1 type II CRISPR-associated endonuclease Cas1 [Liquorilactobacillus nagelii]